MLSTMRRPPSGSVLDSARLPFSARPARRRRARAWQRARLGSVRGLGSVRAPHPAGRKWCVRNALLRVLFRKPGSGIRSSAILQRFRTD